MILRAIIDQLEYKLCQVAETTTDYEIQGKLIECSSPWVLYVLCNNPNLYPGIIDKLHKIGYGQWIGMKCTIG